MSAPVTLEDLQAELKLLREMLAKQAQPPPAAVPFEEAARLMCCSPKHVGHLVKTGVIRVARVGQLRRIPMTEIHRLTSPAMPEIGQSSPAQRPALKPSIPESVRLKAMLKGR